MSQCKICFICGDDGNESSINPCYFSFPQNDDRRREWAKAMKIDFDRVYAYDYLCTKHFHPEEITDRRSTGGRCTLKNSKIIPHLENETPKKCVRRRLHLQQRLNLRRRLHFSGDFRSSDMLAPNKAIKFYKIAKTEIIRNRAKIKFLAEKNKRLLKRIKTYRGLLEHLKKNKLSENATNHLMTSIPGSMREVIERHL